MVFLEHRGGGVGSGRAFVHKPDTESTPEARNFTKLTELSGIAEWRMIARMASGGTLQVSLIS